jgi:hypothetical protein
MWQTAVADQPLGQYAPLPRKTADQVFQRICRSRAKDQFST